MSLEVKNIKRVVLGQKRRYGVYISFFTNGEISLSSEAVSGLNVGENDKAVFFQDEANPSDWYFSFGPMGDYKLKRYKSQPGRASFCSKELRNEIEKSIKPDAPTFRLWLSAKPVELEGKKLWKLLKTKP